MKSAIFILLHTASLALGLSRADVTQHEAQLLCGDLGVMQVPDGVDPSSVRACKEHPSIHDTEDVMKLEKRKCWYGKDFGCSKKGWCFRNCNNGGTGAWCWTTVGGPLSDWKKSTAIHTKKRFDRSKVVYFGHWISNKPNGYRQYPYSTNMTVNPLTYASVNGLTEVHDIGTIWASVLYEMLWNLIDKHGNTDTQLPKYGAKGVPTDGKYLAMKLIIDSFALQPCNPNMVQSRDSIIDADVALTGGANKCELWKAFAKRGFRTNAKFGDTRNEDFTFPAGVCP